MLKSPQLDLIGVILTLNLNSNNRANINPLEVQKEKIECKG